MILHFFLNQLNTEVRTRVTSPLLSHWPSGIKTLHVLCALAQGSVNVRAKKHQGKRKYFGLEGDLTFQHLDLTYIWLAD